MSPGPKKKKVLLLDGHSLAYRAFYALPPELRTTSGTPTNAVYGFTGMLIKAIQTLGTRSLVAAFDKGLPASRLAIRPEYKAQRTAAPDEFRSQIGLIHEVLSALNVRMYEIPGVEADDILAILARSLAAQGAEVVILTADRDFFQLVGPRITLMMNKRGITETVVYDEAAVRERYGFGPEHYLDYAALRGDPSDNIEGVAGIGEKTAARLIQAYGTLENVIDNLDQLTPKIRANLTEAAERLLVNKEFFKFRSSQEIAAEGANIDGLDVALGDLQMGPWDFNKIRQLFDSLEFRVLYDRLTAGSPEALAAATGFEGSTAEVVSEQELADLVEALKGAETLTARFIGDETSLRKPPHLISIATSEGAKVIRIGPGNLPAEMVWSMFGPVIRASKLATHGSKEALERLAAVGVAPREVAMDTEIAAYLVDPARGSYKLNELARHYLDRELKLDASGDIEESGQGVLLLEEDVNQAAEDHVTGPGLEAIATAELAEVLSRELNERGAWPLFTELELPLAAVLAKIEIVGIRLDSSYLDDMSITLTKQLEAAQYRIFDLAGGPFNIGSPPQLRTVLYDKLGLKPSKKTKTGYSTDAAVLESLADEHPIIERILRHREISKLKSTYIDALPRLVDPVTGRLHTRFNQTVATTGRLSSDRPNLQNIPIRTEEGKAIRRAFIPDDAHVLLVADYSQIELRLLAHLSGDEELVGAFARGDDIHRLSIGKALGIPYEQVTSAQRNIGKMVSYGVTYGMGAFGLSQRLKIPVDQARTYIEGFFASYPRVRTYLDSVVAQATADGFTTTMLGRRRYLPELQSRNPRVRGLGERQALNAPLQGSAADIMKLSMVKADRALDSLSARKAPPAHEHSLSARKAPPAHEHSLSARKAPSAHEHSLPARMVLSVHDELVFEVPEAGVEEVAEVIRQAMENAIELSVPLTVDLAWGPNWADAKA